MGTWGASITGNDTALDLIDEYKAAFYKFDVDTAVSKIDQYVRTMFDETDEEEWVNYYYSLADFMWKKGILTDEIRDRAVQMVDSDFGMQLWIEAGTREENARRKELQKFREKILSPQCAPKKIRLDFHMEDIFNDGEYVAFRLKTLEKHYNREAGYAKLSEEEFQACNDKYVVVQKIMYDVSQVSQIVPEVCDRWAVFRLFKGMFDSPDDIRIEDLKEADFRNGLPYFYTESSMFHFKKRGFVVIGSGPIPENVKNDYANGLYLGINHETYNPDSLLVKSVYPFKIEISEYSSSISSVYTMLQMESRIECGEGEAPNNIFFKKFREKVEKMTEKKKKEIDSMLEKGAKIYELRHNNVKCVAVKVPKKKARIIDVSSDPEYRKMLEEYVNQQP